MESAFLEIEGRQKIHYSLVRPEVPGGPSAAVFLTPGFGEHLGRYREAIQLWAARGFLVAAHDLRGQGRSEGRPGHVDSFDDYLQDAQAVLAELARDTGWNSLGTPILFGHSTGGLIAAHLALRAPKQFRGLALGSPYFGLALKPPVWKVLLGRLLTRVHPTFSEPTGITGALVTHDPEMIADSDNDPQGIPRVTARWFTETEAAQELLLSEAARLTLPIYCQAAGDDRVASLQMTREVFVKSPSADKELIVREGAFHELHREVNRLQYLNAFADKFSKWAA